MHLYVINDSSDLPVDIPNDSIVLSLDTISSLNKKTILLAEFTKANDIRLRRSYLAFNKLLFLNTYISARQGDLLPKDDTIAASSVFNPAIWSSSTYINHLVALFALRLLVRKYRITSVFFHCLPLAPIKSAFENYCIYKKISFHSFTHSFPDLPFLNSLISAGTKFLLSILLRPFIYILASLFFSFISFSSSLPKATNRQRPKFLFFSYLSFLDQTTLSDSLWSPILNLPSLTSQSFSIIYISTLESIYSFLFSRSQVNLLSKLKFLRESLHTFTYISPTQAILIAVRYYLSFIRSTPRFILALYFLIKNNLWLLLINDLFDTFFGSSCYYRFYFESSFSNFYTSFSLDPSHICLYPFENCDWELINSRVHRSFFPNSLLYGYQHSSVCFWDFRYFNPIYSISHDFLPDLILANSPLSFKLLQDFNHLSVNIFPVEATRYTNLTTTTLSDIQYDILFIADYSLSSTYYCFRLLLDSLSFLPNSISSKIRVIYKPHATHRKTIFNSMFPCPPNVEFAVSPLTSLFSRSNVVICCSNTSAVLDSICSNKHTFVCMPSIGLPINPLYRFDDSIFFTNPFDLYKNLMPLLFEDSSLPKTYFASDFLYSSSDLRMWSSILKASLK